VEEILKIRKTGSDRPEDSIKQTIEHRKSRNKSSMGKVETVVVRMSKDKSKVNTKHSAQKRS